jgi:hypothetical protein
MTSIERLRKYKKSLEEKREREYQEKSLNKEIWALKHPHATMAFSGFKNVGGNILKDMGSAVYRAANETKHAAKSKKGKKIIRGLVPKRKGTFKEYLGVSSPKFKY